MTDPDQSGGTWTLLTGHGHVLVEIARDPEARIRDISAAVGLTERTVQAIVADLEAAGHPPPRRPGRRSRGGATPRWSPAPPRPAPGGARPPRRSLAGRRRRPARRRRS